MQLPVQPESLKKVSAQTLTQDVQTDWRQWDFAPLGNIKSSNALLGEVLGLAAIILAPFFLIFWVLLQNLETALISTFFLGIFNLIIIGFIFSKRNERQITSAYREFARLNGLNYRAESDSGTRAGSLFSHGHSRRIKHHFQWKFHDWPLELFNYQYVTGSGKSSRTNYATVAEISLPRTMPHMVLDSQLEDSGGSVLPIQFDKNQRIKLEGDFDNYIHLYAPDNYQIAALSILTPDVMQTLLSFKKYCDIEIIGQRLYFYWPGNAGGAADYRDIMAVIERVLSEIGTKLRDGAIFASQAQAQVHSSPAATGIRLKKSSIGWLTALIIVGYVVARINIFGEVASVLIILAILAPIAWRLWRTRRLRHRLKERQSYK